VSGGVDSLTLMAFAHSRGYDAVAFHATSAAVPPSSTERVREMAARFSWSLTVLDAGEVADPLYRANPVDRCRICKSHLYDAARAFVGLADARALASGTNLDDMSDYRPGLDAAAARGVQHPFVDARMNKTDVRALARELGLGDVAELPAQPCLASRLETGMHIDEDTLAMVNAVEDAVRARIGMRANVRCRVRKDGVVIEMDASALDDLSLAGKRAIVDVARTVSGIDVALAPYQMGSAFLRVL
ncbi:MAG TPA: adenine nucleotide alpha hydrolase, partial [Myxococcota bacterium]